MAEDPGVVVVAVAAVVVVARMVSKLSGCRTKSTRAFYGWDSE